MQITEKYHITVILETLTKLFKDARLNGVLNIKDVYFLNVLHKLIKDVSLELTPEQSKLLILKYYNFIECSKDICRTPPRKDYFSQPDRIFQQADKTDCNTYPVKKAIFYYQSEFYKYDSELTDLIVQQDLLRNLPSKTYLEFQKGVEIPFNRIGRIVFIATDTQYTDFKIFDALGNNVSHTFIQYNIEELNSVLIVSDNQYINENINFKIKK